MLVDAGSELRNISMAVAGSDNDPIEAFGSMGDPTTVADIGDGPVTLACARAGADSTTCDFA